jgi:hypothetical protein
MLSARLGTCFFKIAFGEKKSSEIGVCEQVLSGIGPVIGH